MAELAKTFPVPTRGVGLPDYSTAAPVGQVPVGPVYTSSDTAELAARLGAPITFDRRGNVIWFDDFENGLEGWNTNAFGIGASVSLSIERRLHGARSCKLITGNLIDDYAIITRFLAYPYLSKLGWQVAFTIPTTACRIHFGIFAYAVSQSISFSLEYDNTAQVLRYHNGLAYVTFQENVPLYSDAGNNLFHIAKIVGDPATGLFTRLVLDNTEYDISTITGFTGAGVALPFMIVSFDLTASAAANMTGFVDSGIVTQNEPQNA